MKQLLTRDECKEIINFAEDKKSWQKVLWNAKVATSGVADYDFCDISDLTWYKDKLIQYALEELNLKLYSASVAIIKYGVGSKFPRHTDRSPNNEFNMDFLYNVNVVLNDDFEGGEFWLDDKPVAGNTPGVVYHYKSTQWHEVKEVTKGVRYTTLFYIRDRDTTKNKNLI